MVRAGEVRSYTLVNMTGGMNTMDEETKLTSFGKDPTEFVNLENYIPLRRGGQRTERGFTVHKDTGSGSPIRGMTKYTKADGTEHFMVATGGQLYELEGDLSLTVVAGVSEPAQIDFEQAYNYLVFCDGVNHARTFDGTTVGNLTTSKTPPKQSRFYLDTLFLYLPDESFLYYSDVGDIFNGYNTNQVKCDNDDGSNITGLEKLFVQGQFTSALVVGKDSAVGALVGDGTASNPFTYVQLNQDAGIPGHKVMLQHNQDVSFLTNKGVSSYQLTQQDVNLGYTVLTRKVLNKFIELDRTLLASSHAIYDWRNSRIRFFVAENGQAAPNVVWNYDTELNCWYKTRYPYDITASYVDKDGTVWLGTAGGLILKASDTVYSFNNLPISTVLTTGFMDFGEPNIRKQILDMRVTAQGQGTYGFGVSTRLDDGERVGRSGTINLQGASYKWGDGTWTDDPDTYQWGGVPISVSRFIPGGYFRNFQLEFNGNSADEPFDIFRVDFRVRFMGFR